MNAMCFRRFTVLFSIVTLAVGIFGCEGIDRRHDARVNVDVQPPSEEAPLGTTEQAAQLADFPDLVEGMLAVRENLISVRSQYFEQLLEMERAYLLAGDTVKANWARRQRERLELASVDTFPYLTEEAPEQCVEIAPEESIAEADTIYRDGLAALDEFRHLPFVGHLENNKKKARKALGLFKRVLREYPKSDKVDDCAYYIADIYKEYLRDEDPDNELAIRYYKWAFALDPETPHAARFDCAVVYDFRRHDRARAVELYRQALEVEEAGNYSNLRFAASRIEQLTDDEFSPIRPAVNTAAPSPITANIEDDETGTADPTP